MFSDEHIDNRKYDKGWAEGRDDLADAVVSYIWNVSVEFDEVEEFAENVVRIVEHELSKWKPEEDDDQDY